MEKVRFMKSSLTAVIPVMEFGLMSMNWLILRELKVLNQLT